MTLSRRSLTLLATAAAAAFTILPRATLAADAWPTKPITLVVPFAAGGTTDIVARQIAQKLGEGLHQTVVVDNRPGAGGTLAATYVAKAPADGHTIFLAAIAHSIAPSIYKKLSYDFQKDFAPIGLVATTPNVLLVNPAVPAKTVPELVAYIKANPGKVNYGSAGIGSTEHMAGELFRSLIGGQITHVPYKGGAPMMTDLMGGQIDMAIETSPSAEPHVKSGRVRALAVTTAKRSPAYPTLPTLEEAGVKGYEFTTWYALVAPRATPAAVQQRLVTELGKLLKDPAVEARFKEQGVSAAEMTPAQTGAFIEAETARWGRIAKSAGIVAE